MRLNRRKNRGSRDRRKRPLGREENSASKAPSEDRDERRRGLGETVQSLRSEGGKKRREPRGRSAGRGEGRAERARRTRRRRRPRLRLPQRRRGQRGERAAQRDALVRAARSVGADALGVAREILRWPARIWMAVAEALGAAILQVWRRALLPALRIAWRSLRVAIGWAERTVTPARGLAIAALAATIALGGSQFGDYRAVEVGTPQYAEVENVAPAPQVARAMPSSAHGISVFAIAVASLFVLLFSVWRNWRLARLLLFGGVAVIAISLFVDRPDGLRLGTAGEAYSGAHAVLLGPFWVQLFAGVTLVVVGPLLAIQLRGERAVRRRRSTGRHEEKAKTKRAPRLRPGVGT
jgi:hypothetical protein